MSAPNPSRLDRDHIFNETKCRASVRARKSFQGRALVVSGPLAKVKDAIKMAWTKI